MNGHQSQPTRNETATDEPDVNKQLLERGLAIVNGEVVEIKKPRRARKQAAEGVEDGVETGAEVGREVFGRLYSGVGKAVNTAVVVTVDKPTEGAKRVKSNLAETHKQRLARFEAARAERKAKREAKKQQKTQDKDASDS